MRATCRQDACAPGIQDSGKMPALLGFNCRQDACAPRKFQVMDSGKLIASRTNRAQTLTTNLFRSAGRQVDRLAWSDSSSLDRPETV